MSILDSISKAWSDLLAFMSTLVIPDWSALIGLLPLFVLVGMIGPILTLIILGWLGYAVTKPRVKVSYVEGTKVAPRDHLGRPIVPAGEPYCPKDGLIYASGTTRCDVDKANLLVRCPKCEVVREAAIQACGNCGLVLRLEPRTLIIAADRPPPGGAAIA